ncbi:MAG: alpha/beta hydrolase, partial [Verrucomicrobiota bacterium]|nr:alpha/beta hydrolase [Verrucomicrobiota bacterium]
AGSCHSAVEPLLGGTPEKFPQRYAETSPSQRLPLGVPQIFIQGERDPIVDPASVRAYVEAAKKSGDRAEILPIPDAGHFESSVPIAATTPMLEDGLRALLGEATH